MKQGYLFDEPYFDNREVSFMQETLNEWWPYMYKYFDLYLSQILIYQAHYDIYLHN